MSDNGDTATEELAAEPETIERSPVTTAFLVIMREDGICLADGNLNLINDITLAREATIQDMYRASMEVAKDVNKIEIVAATIEAIQGLEEMHQIQKAQKKRHTKVKAT